MFNKVEIPQWKFLWITYSCNSGDLVVSVIFPTKRPLCYWTLILSTGKNEANKMLESLDMFPIFPPVLETEISKKILVDSLESFGNSLMQNKKYFYVKNFNKLHCVTNWSRVVISKKSQKIHLMCWYLKLYYRILRNNDGVLSY